MSSVSRSSAQVARRGKGSDKDADSSKPASNGVQAFSASELPLSPTAREGSSSAAAQIAKASALLCICIMAFSLRLFSVVKYESVIHEFDPYFNYRVTQYLTKEGFLNMWNWFDDRTWYPLGRVIGGTMYPVRPGQSAADCLCRQIGLGCVCNEELSCTLEGIARCTYLLDSQLSIACRAYSLHALLQGLIMTAGVMYNVLHFFNIPIHVQEVCQAAQLSSQG